MMQIRVKRRWTLGGLMILIALLAVPLAVYMRHVRQVQQRQALIRDLEERLDAKAKELTNRGQIMIQKNVFSSGVPSK
jgi:hypothetical protein